MSMKIHPRRDSLYRVRQDGLSQARYEKTVPQAGDENNKKAIKEALKAGKDEKTVPQAGDENMLPPLIKIIVDFIHEKTVPQAGDENRSQLPSDRKSVRFDEKTVPQAGDENFNRDNPQGCTLLPMKKQFPKQGTKIAPLKMEIHHNHQIMKKQFPKQGTKTLGTLLTIHSVSYRDEKTAPQAGDENLSFGLYVLFELAKLMKKQLPKQGTKTYDHSGIGAYIFR